MANFRDVVHYYRRYWPITVFSIMMMSLFEIVDLFVPYAIGQILNVLSNQPLDGAVQAIVTAAANFTGYASDRTFTLIVLLVMVGVVSIGRAPIQPWLGPWFSWDTAFRARRDHARKALEKVLTLPLEFYDVNNSGRIAARVAKGLSNSMWSYPVVTGQMIPKLLRLVGIFAVIWLIEWRIGLVTVLSFIVILTLNLVGLLPLMQQDKKLDKYMEDTESRTSEIITNIKTVKAFATEAAELARQQQRFDREFKVLAYRIHKGFVMLGMQQRTIVQTCVFLVLVFTLIATVQGNLSLGHFITTLTVSSMAYAEVEPISDIAEMVARRYASIIHFIEMLQLPAGQDAGSLLPNPPTYQFTGKVELSHLRFGYDPNRPVLQDINLLIEPYQTIALVGRSGSGKSTLVKLLFRYFEPNDGAILMDGQDIRRLDVTGYRRRLAIVHQEVDIFNGTILANLTYGNPAASFEEVQEACRIAQADEFIRQMPKGYATVVGERGVRLSGGQRQRIGIARALIMNPDVLVFDEATSSLDYESERSIQLAMRAILGTRTLIIIAHRLSTVREADKIVVLEKGQIVEVGSHEQLLSHGGIYHRLHALQETGELLA